MVWYFQKIMSPWHFQSFNILLLSPLRIILELEPLELEELHFCCLPRSVLPCQLAHHNITSCVLSGRHPTLSTTATKMPLVKQGSVPYAMALFSGKECLPRGVFLDWAAMFIPCYPRTDLGQQWPSSPQTQVGIFGQDCMCVHVFQARLYKITYTIHKVI